MNHSFSIKDENVAVKFLFDNLDRMPHHTEASRAYLEFLPAFFRLGAFRFGAIGCDCGNSPGTWGRYQLRQECRVEAHKRYGEAIVRANTAIRDPPTAKKSEALIARLLLAILR